MDKSPLTTGPITGREIDFGMEPDQVGFAIPYHGQRIPIYNFQIDGFQRLYTDSSPPYCRFHYNQFSIRISIIGSYWDIIILHPGDNKPIVFNDQIDANGDNIEAAMVRALEIIGAIMLPPATKIIKGYFLYDISEKAGSKNYAWWREEGMGYTEHLNQAGVFTKKRAESIVKLGSGEVKAYSATEVMDIALKNSYEAPEIYGHQLKTIKSL